MRTTLTIDDDIALKMKQKVRNGATFKKVVNETLRHGLLYEEKLAAKPLKPFKIRGARNTGLRPGFNLDKTSELIEQLEGPLHR